MKNRIIFLLTLLPLYFNGEACTVISCAIKGEVLAGANEDYDNPFIKMWFNRHARQVWIGLLWIP